MAKRTYSVPLFSLALLLPALFFASCGSIEVKGPGLLNENALGFAVDLAIEKLEIPFEK